MGALVVCHVDGAQDAVAGARKSKRDPKVKLLVAAVPSYSHAARIGCHVKPYAIRPPSWKSDAISTTYPRIEGAASHHSLRELVQSDPQTDVSAVASSPAGETLVAGWTDAVEARPPPREG
jgi:hypothetical protein